VIKLLLTAFVLGLASLDVTGALLAVGALGAGARTPGFELFLYPRHCRFRYLPLAHSRAANRGHRPGHSFSPRPQEDRVAAFVDIVLGAGLLIWGIVRILRPGTRPPKPSAPRGLGLISLAGAGILFALAAIADPTFISLVLIAGRAEHFWSVLAAHSTWTLVSHIPLVLVLVFALSVDHGRVVVWVHTLWARTSPWLFRSVTGLVVIVGILFLHHALGWYLTGELF
jgi:hypothetical protein